MVDYFVGRVVISGVDDGLDAVEDGAEYDRRVGDALIDDLLAGFLEESGEEGDDGL